MIRTSHTRLLIAIAALHLAFVGPSFARDWQVVPEESVFAVVTHKDGVGAKLAHNHLITASNFEAQLTYDAAAPETSRFSFAVAVEDLQVDTAAQQQRWYPRLEELTLLDEAFGELADKDRKKIRDSMLSKKQLNAKKFPRLTAEIVGLRQATAAAAQADTPWKALPWLVSLKLTIAGKTVTRTIHATYEPKGDQVHFEAVGAMTFSEFDIKPYSAMLGAIRNDDTFHLFVSFLAAPAGE